MTPTKKSFNRANLPCFIDPEEMGARDQKHSLVVGGARIEKVAMPAPSVVTAGLRAGPSIAFVDPALSFDREGEGRNREARLRGNRVHEADRMEEIVVDSLRALPLVLYAELPSGTYQGTGEVFEPLGEISLASLRGSGKNVNIP